MKVELHCDEGRKIQGITVDVGQFWQRPDYSVQKPSDLFSNDGILTISFCFTYGFDCCSCVSDKLRYDDEQADGMFRYFIAGNKMPRSWANLSE